MNRILTVPSYERALLEASLDPLVTISPQGKITDVNQATEQITGIDRDALIGTDFSDYFTEPDKARNGYQLVLLQGRVTDYPLVLRHASGKVTEVLYNANLYRDAAGEVIGVFAAARDVTSLKLIEHQLRASSHYARSLLEASVDPLVTINTEGKITDVNAATEQVTGVNRSRLIGHDFSGYFTEPEKARAGYRKVFAEGAVNDYPLTIRHTSGRTTEVLYNASVYRDEMGRISGVFAAARDVTRINAMTKELEQHRNHLEELVELRTRELQAAKLAAELASEVKSAFLSNMSHELRTPMNAILGMAHLLKNSGLSAPQLAKVDKLLGAGHQLLGLIDDILNFTRLDSSTLPHESTSFELGALLDAVLARFQERATSKQLNLSTEIAPDIPRQLKGDAGQISQVLAKLTDNAIKFSDAGNIRLQVSLVEADPDAVRLRFTILDHGIGLSEEERAGLFQTFNQADNSTTRKYGGTGLGLAIARRIVESLGGEIGVDSRKGEGSSFWFMLRLERNPTAAAPTLAAPRPEAEPSAMAVAEATAEPAAASEAAAPVDCAWASLRQQLHELLGRDDINSPQCLETNAACIQAALGQRYPAFAAAVLDFDYARALELLDEAM